MRAAIFLVALCAGLLHAADATLAVPANRKADGLAPMQRLVFDEIGRYNESRSAALQDWHPTQREILIGTRFADIAQLAKKKNRDFLNAAAAGFVQKYLLGEK